MNRYQRTAPLRSPIMALAVLAIAIATPSLAAALPGGVSAVTAVEGIEEYRLENGLRVLLFPDPTKETATVNITYLVGSRHEGYGETGMAHLLEHLLFKGTPNHPNIYQELTSHGCRSNGTTWYDRTNYFETFQSTEENIDWALEMEADRMVNSFIAKKDLDSEMSVVRNEFERGENEPRSVLEERLMSAAYLWHNYGKSTIGSRADIENVPIERLQAFYRTWYQPDNAILIVAGRFDKTRVLGRIAGTFGRIPRPERQIPATYTVEPAQDGERSVILRRVGETPVAMVGYHIPAGSHPEFAAIDVLAFVLGDEPAGRLYKSLVETRMATRVGAWAYQLAEPGMLLLTVEAPKGSPIEQIRDELIRGAESLVVAPPTEEEVARARESLLKQWEMSMRNTQWSAIGLSEWAAMGDWRLVFVHRDRLKQITPASVQAAAAKYLRQNNRTVGLYVPTETAERVEVPPVTDIAAMVKDYKGGEGLAAGEEFDSSPAAIEASLVRATLPSGAKVVILPKRTRGKTVHASLAFHMGDEQSLRGKASIGELTGAMLMRGTEKRSRQEIRDEIDRLGARLWVRGGASRVGGSIETTSEHFEACLRLAAEILQQPSFPGAEFDQLKQERILDLEDSKKEPQAVAFTTLQRHLRPFDRDDIRYLATPEEEIERLKDVQLSQLGEFHRVFYGASAGEIGIVGDVDPQQVLAVLGELFDGWKGAQAYRRIVTEYQDRPAIDSIVEIPDKEGAILVGGVRLQMSDTDPDYPAMILGNYLTGGGFLDSRLAVRLRQKEGISYGVGSRFQASSWDRDGSFGMMALCAPQNAELARTAVREEIGRILEAGFTPEEIAKGQSGWLQSRKVSRSNERELASALADSEELGRTLAWEEELERKVGALTAAQVLAAMRAHLSLEGISMVRVGTFAKPASSEAKPGAAGASSN